MSVLSNGLLGETAETAGAVEVFGTVASSTIASSIATEGVFLSCTASSALASDSSSACCSS